MDNYTPDPFNTAQNPTEGSSNGYSNSEQPVSQATNVNSGYNDYTDMYSQQNVNTNNTYGNQTYNNGYNQTYNNGYNQTYNNGYNQTYNNSAYNQGYNANGYNNAGYNQTYNNGYNQTYNNGYNQGYVNRTPYTNPAGYQPVVGNFPSYTTYLVLSIISIVLTCWPAGLVALLQTISANNAFKNGDAVKYQKGMKNAKIAMIVGVVYFVFYIIIVFLAAFLNA